MTNSKSRASINRLLPLIAAVLVMLAATTANAGRKRLVVLDFEGPKAEKFHGDLVKLLKKSNTVLAAEKWGEKDGDAKPSKDNIKKVAKKLKLDGVITGTVEKRRDQYILRLKLHAGASGKMVGDPSFKAEGAKIDSEVAGQIKDELGGQISALKENRGGGGGDEDEEEEKPKKVAKKTAPKEEEEEEEKPKKSGFSKKSKEKEEEEEENPLPKKVAKKTPAKEEEEEEKPKKAAKGGEEEEEEEGEKPKKKVASSEEEEEEGGSVGEEGEVGGKMDSERALSPGNRAVDAVVGLSFSARRMGFKYAADVPQAVRPPRYKGTPVPGLIFDATIYPLAFGHKSDGMAKNFGLTVLYDKVLLVNSQDPMGNKLKSAQGRFAVGAAFRYPFNKSATAPVIGGHIRYGKQKFEISGNSGIPNVDYTIIDPAAFFHYPLSTKMALNVDVGYLAVTGTGAIQTMASYGAASVTGVEFNLGGDYNITKNILIRAAFRLETIGFAFKGNGMLSNKDGDPESEVSGARDTYVGGMLSAGYLY